MHVFGYAQEQKVQKLYRFSTKNGFIFVQSAVMFLQNLILLPYLIFMITRGRDGFNTKKTGLFSQFSQFPFSKPYIFRQCVDLGKFRHFDAKTQKSGAPQHSAFLLKFVQSRMSRQSSSPLAPVNVLIRPPSTTVGSPVPPLASRTSFAATAISSSFGCSYFLFFISVTPFSR